MNHEAFPQKHQSKIITVYKCQKDFKCHIKDLITMQLKKIFGHFCDIQHFNIITRNITDAITGHIQLLGILYNF